jgi:hypothetical protein
LAFGPGNGLGDGGHNLGAFADTYANTAFAITDYYCSPEAEAASTLDDSCNPVDSYNFFFEFFGFLYDSHD